MDETSALASVRALRNQVFAKLQQNEDFRVLIGLDFVLAKEAGIAAGGNQLAQGEAKQPGARAVQDGLAASMATQPLSSGLSPDEQALSFPKVPADETKPADTDEEKASVLLNTRTSTHLVRELRRLAGT